MGDAEAPKIERATRILITGRVQGVGYRHWLSGEAAAHRLRGYVRNRRDGDVEALLVGEGTAIDAVVQACHRGPAMARVDRVSTTDGTGEPWPHPDFRQLSTI